MTFTITEFNTSVTFQSMMCTTQLEYEARKRLFKLLGYKHTSADGEHTHPLSPAGMQMIHEPEVVQGIYLSAPPLHYSVGPLNYKYYMVRPENTRIRVFDRYYTSAQSDMYIYDVMCDDGTVTQLSSAAINANLSNLVAVTTDMNNIVAVGDTYTICGVDWKVKQFRQVPHPHIENRTLVEAILCGTHEFSLVPCREVQTMAVPMSIPVSILTGDEFKCERGSEYKETIMPIVEKYHTTRFDDAGVLGESCQLLSYIEWQRERNPLYSIKPVTLSTGLKMRLQFGDHPSQTIYTTLPTTSEDGKLLWTEQQYPDGAEFTIENDMLRIVARNTDKVPDIFISLKPQE